MVRTVGKVVVAAVLILVVLVTMMWAFQRRLIYLSGAGAPPEGADVVAGAEEWTLRTDDGLDLLAWFVPAAQPRPDGTTVLVAPGNAGNRADRAPLAQALAEAGFDVLLVDYRGYGGNPGSPTEAGLALDIRAAYDALRDRGVASDGILLFGESLGAAVVTALAADVPAVGLVLRSPFTDLAAVAADAYRFLPEWLVRRLLWDEFPLLDQIDAVGIPVAIVYGTSDSIVDPQQSLRVAAAAPDLVATVAIEGADHNDAALAYGPQVVAAVQAIADAGQ